MFGPSLEDLANLPPPLIQWNVVGCPGCGFSSSGLCEQHRPKPHDVAGVFQKMPHRCPVCSGAGQVPADFYIGLGVTTTVEPEQCRSCEGKGIVWG